MGWQVEQLEQGATQSVSYLTGTQSCLFTAWSTQHRVLHNKDKWLYLKILHLLDYVLTAWDRLRGKPKRTLNHLVLPKWKHGMPYVALFIGAHTQNGTCLTTYWVPRVFFVSQHTLAKMLTLGIFSNSQLSPRAAQIWFNTVNEDSQHERGWLKMLYEKQPLMEMLIWGRRHQIFSIILNTGSTTENQQPTF